MRILTYIALHNRSELEEYFYPGLRRFVDFAHDYGIKMKCLFIYSNEADKARAKKYFKTAIFVRHKNLPLGEKLNAGLDRALKEDWNYMMQLGCDDVLIPSYLQKVREYLESGADIIGMTKFYMWKFGTDQVKESVIHPLIIGGGRFLSRSIIEKCCKCVRVIPLVTSTGGIVRGKEITIHEKNFRKYAFRLVNKETSIWTNEKNNGLDSDSLQNLIDRTMNGKIPTIRMIPVHEAYLLDIKTADNINKFDKVQGSDVSDEILQKFLNGTYSQS